MKSVCVLLSGALASVSFDFRVKNNAEDLASSKGSLSSGAKFVGEKPSMKVAVGQDVTLTPSYNFYYGDIYIGTPSQRAEVLLDTGSPVSWVFGPNGSSNDAPMFYYNESSTFSWENESFSARYGSGQYLGHWAHDYVYTDISVLPKGVNGTSTSSNGTSSTLNGTAGIYNGSSPRVDFELGVVSSFAAAAGAPGLLGLSPHIEGSGPSSYKTFPEALFAQNVTSSSAFSVLLDGSAGKFIFGGVDLAQAELPFHRFQGEVNNTNYAGTWIVHSNTLQLDHGDNYTWRSPVTLDTGSPITLLPQGFVRKVAEKFNLSKNEKYEAYYTDSDPSKLNGTVTFNLGHLAVDIPISKLFVPASYIWLNNGPQNVSALSLVPSPNFLLGDSFFRHVYTVFDSSSSSVYISRRRHTNSSKIVDVSDIPAVNGDIESTTSQVNSTSTSAESGVATPLIQNRYLGPVTSDNKAASEVATTTATASASSAASSSDSSHSSSNGGSIATLSGLLAALAIIA